MAISSQRLLDELDTKRPQSSQNYQPSRYTAAGSSHHGTDTQSDSDRHPAPPASILCLNGVDNQSQGHQSLREEPVSPVTITRSQRRPRIFSTTNQTIAHYLSTNKDRNPILDGPSTSADSTRPSRPDQAKPDQDSSQQLQLSAKQSQVSLTPNNDYSTRRGTHFAQRRGAIDYGRRYGPLATMPDDDVGPEKSNGEEEEERPYEILVKLRDHWGGRSITNRDRYG